uniref:DOMON domain-containing protein n=1 Tax=Leptobrachium leishanense TaxID=445787 RepID=A0A8C5P9T0_9ANUR
MKAGVGLRRHCCSLIAAVLCIAGSLKAINLDLSEVLHSRGSKETATLVWGYDRENEEIILEVQVLKAKWIGLGLSPDGSLNGSDFVIGGWDEQGEVFLYVSLQNMYGEWPPVKDDSQDYKLMEMKNNDTHSFLKVWRKLFTCDPFDQDIEFLIPEQDTTYACTFLPVPQVSTKHHYEPLIDPRSLGIVHHILIYACPNSTDITSEVGDCYGSDARFSQCATSVFGWAVGGEAFFYPAELGVPIGTEDDPQYMRIEVHFSNFDGKQGIMDSSGIRIMYTPELRKHDAAILMVGVFTFPVQFIPPGAKDFKNYGMCDTSMIPEVSNCANVIIPMRNTVFLLRHLLCDFYIIIFINILICLPQGGPSTLNEMCIAFLFYYPKRQIAACWSLIDLNYITEALGQGRGDRWVPCRLCFRGDSIHYFSRKARLGNLTGLFKQIRKVTARSVTFRSLQFGSLCRSHFGDPAVDSASTTGSPNCREKLPQTLKN